MPTIYIRKDETFRTRKEDVTRSDLFFSPVYTQARDCLKGIVNFTEQYWQTHSGNEDPVRTEKDYNPLRLRGYPNNIIAFCAKRGSGKTSAMLSFSAALEYAKDDKDFWGNEISDARFIVLDPIDPTELEQSDSVIRTIISRMFQRFLGKSIETYMMQERRAAQQELLKSFQTCFRMADRQKEKEHHNDDYDDLQRLTEMGDSSTLKRELSTLFSRYLNFIFASDGKQPSKKDQFLVIQIDDADMNTTNAYEVVEDIRKYCVVPNVVVLMAADMSLLEQTVEQHFVHSFESIIKTTAGDSSKHTAVRSRERCHRTTVSYLDKLIPSLHRINMPDINAELRAPRREVRISLYEMADGKNKDKDRDKQPKEEFKEGEYQQVLIELLNKRCLFRLPFNAEDPHPFLPVRMRELNHFMHLILSMQECACTLPELIRWASGDKTRDCSGSVKILQANLEALLDYFLHDWCELRLTHKQRDVVEKIHGARVAEKLQTALDCCWIYDPPKEDFEGEGWKKLMNMTAEMRKMQGDESANAYASALELYFQLMKLILLVYDCEEQAKEQAKERGESHG